MILWIHQSRPRPEWYDLPTERQQTVLEAWEAIRTATAHHESIDFLGEYSIRGQSAQERVEVWKFADVTQLDDHWTRLEAANYLDWRETENLVGTEPIPYIGMS